MENVLIIRVFPCFSFQSTKFFTKKKKRKFRTISLKHTHTHILTICTVVKSPSILSNYLEGRGGGGEFSNNNNR